MITVQRILKSIYDRTKSIIFVCVLALLFSGCWTSWGVQVEPMPPVPGTTYIVVDHTPYWWWEGRWWPHQYGYYHYRVVEPYHHEYKVEPKHEQRKSTPPPVRGGAVRHTQTRSGRR